MLCEMYFEYLVVDMPNKYDVSTQDLIGFYTYSMRYDNIGKWKRHHLETTGECTANRWIVKEDCVSGIGDDHANHAVYKINESWWI